MLDSHNVATSRRRSLAENLWKRLQQALSNKIAVWYKRLEFFHQLVVQLCGFGNDAGIVLETSCEKGITFFKGKVSQ